MTAPSFPRSARLIAIVAVVAVAVPLVASDRASGFHEPGWIEPLLDRPDFTLNVVRGDGYLAWTESSVVCCTTQLGYANGAGFIQPERAETFKAMLRTPGGEVTQLNPDGVWASVGGIDRGVLAYATGQKQADIRLLDLRTRKLLKLPRGVNTPKVEYHPTISGKWLLFGRVRPDKRGDPLWANTSVVLVNLKNGHSRVLSTGKNYRTYTYPGQVNRDWVSFTACKFNKYGPNCGVSRYRISTGERSNANLDGLCCAHGDPHTQNDGGAAPGSVSASAITADGVVYMAMHSGQNTSWCAYAEVHIWDRDGGFAYMFGEKEDEPRHDEPNIGLVVDSLYVDDGNPHRVVLNGYTTHEDHGYDCDVESSALFVLQRGYPPSTPTPSTSPSPSYSQPPETPTPSPSTEPTPTPSPTPSPPPSASPSPTPSPTPPPTPSPTPVCPLPICP